MSVSGARAIASDPRHISPRPYPTASGDPLRAPTINFFGLQQERKCKRSFQPRQRGAYRIDRLASFLELLVYQMSNHLGVCVGGKARASQLEFLPQFAMILDDAVVNDLNAINRVRMRVVFVWTAMSCPARMTNAYAADERLASKPPGRGSEKVHLEPTSSSYATEVLCGRHVCSCDRSDRRWPASSRLMPPSERARKRSICRFLGTSRPTVKTYRPGSNLNDLVCL
jgi:hypothetical protein